MRLAGIQQFLKERHLPFQYLEDDDCGSIEFDHRGLHYHIWEVPKPERGAQSNVRSAGRSEEFGGNYEEAILGQHRTNAAIRIIQQVPNKNCG